MICKYCGARIKPDAPVCSKCGQKAEWLEGNGFWDLLEPPAARNTEAPLSASAEKDADTADEAGLAEAKVKPSAPRPRVSRYVIAAALGVLLFVAGFLAGGLGDRNEIASLKKLVELRTEALEEQERLFAEERQTLEAENEELERSVWELEARLATEQNSDESQNDEEFDSTLPEESQGSDEFDSALPGGSVSADAGESDSAGEAGADDTDEETGRSDPRQSRHPGGAPAWG